MGKLVYLLMAVICVNVALTVVFNSPPVGNSLYDFFVNPSNSWDSLSWTRLLADATTAVSLGAIILGTFIFKSDFIVLAGVATVFFSFGSNLALTHAQVCKEITSYINIADPSNIALWTPGCSGAGAWLASIITVPIMILYIMTIYEWWRGRD